MTVNIAWIRHCRDVDELWVVSDSRLSGNGTVWDQCPKIILLPSGKGFVSFAGNTNIAYPILNIINTAIFSHRSSRLGFMDIREQKNHILRIINNAIDSIEFEIDGFSEKELRKIEFKQTEFLIGGYSWLYKRFVLYKLFYNVDVDKYCSTIENNMPFKKNGGCLIAGDISKKVATRLVLQLDPNAHSPEKSNEIKLFDMEPFEVVRDLLSDKVINNSKEFETIGGAPQIVKVYQHSNAEIIGTFWSNSKDIMSEHELIRKNGKPYLLGRPLEDYENTDSIYLDPYLLKAKRIIHTNFWGDERIEINE